MSAEIFILNGLGFTSNEVKLIKPGTEYEHLFPASDWKVRIVRKNATVQDTVDQMKRVIFSTLHQTKKLAKVLQGASVPETCEAIWNFFYWHYLYSEDDKNEEQLREPARSWAERAIRGIDCDDFTISISSVLLNLHIPHYIRVAKYPELDYYSHVYVVVPYKGREIIIDCVLNQFNIEKPTHKQKDFAMNTASLNGIDIAVLSGVNDASALFAQIVTGSDFAALEGLGAIPSKEQELQALYLHLVKTRELIRQRPDTVQEIEHPETFLKMLDYAIAYWHTDKRDEALRVLEENEEKINAAQGMAGIDADIQLHYLPDALGNPTSLGAVKHKRKFFSKIKEAVKKVGTGIKEKAKDVLQQNPVTKGIRAGVLKALNVNLFRISSRLKWGYLTEAEARAGGFDLGEWNKAKDRLANAKKLFVDLLGGNEEELKKAILQGRAGGLNGIVIEDEREELGAAAAVAAAGTAAGFLAKLQSLAKNIDLKRLLSKVNPLKLKREDKEAADNQAADNNAVIDSKSLPEESGSSSSNSSDSGTNERRSDNAKEESGSSGSGVDVGQFFKDNWYWFAIPLAALLILPPLLKSGKKKQTTGLSGTKKAKKKKKKKQPQALAGTHPKALPAGPKKKGGAKKKKSKKQKIFRSLNY